jgi:hypothetical protein
MNIVNKQIVVKDLLSNFPHLRDDSLALLATVWKLEIQRDKLNLNQTTAFDLLTLIAKGGVSNPESIRRVRAKIQEEVPTLRGEKWLKRQRYQSNIKDQVRQVAADLN